MYAHDGNKVRKTNVYLKVKSKVTKSWTLISVPIALLVGVHEQYEVSNSNSCIVPLNADFLLLF